MVLPKELYKAALVHCERCNADIATWAVFKATTTMIILAEDREHGKDIVGPDPLDVDVMRVHRSGARG